MEIAHTFLVVFKPPPPPHNVPHQITTYSAVEFVGICLEMSGYLSGNVENVGVPYLASAAAKSLKPHILVQISSAQPSFLSCAFYSKDSKNSIACTSL